MYAPDESITPSTHEWRCRLPRPVFVARAPDRYIKADMYRYRFTKLGSEESRKGQVWTRQRIGSFWGTTSRDGLVEAIGPNS